VTRREKIDAVVRDVLAPLLEKDGAGISVVRFEGSVLTLRLTGAMPGCPGTPYVKRGVIEPAIRAAVGRDVDIVYDRPSFSD
jgi:Fe-S cluster biogenesis protein NfuA